MNQRQSTVARVERAQILQTASTLPVEGLSATTLTQLICALCDEGMAADELTLRIEAHPALCGRVLQVANSPYYGQVRSVGTIKRALLLLGLNTIRGITAAACIGQLLPRRLATLPDVAAVLRHSLATAVAAERLAAVQHPMLADDAFVAGVLHNFGVVLQASLDPSGVAAMIAARSADPLPGIRLLESAHCSIGHEDCASTLFEEWRLPESLVATAMYHHDPHGAPAEHRLLVTLVAAGAELALACGYTYSLEAAAQPAYIAHLEDLGLGAQEAQGLLDTVPERMNELTRAFA
jgi:HD-like signal output (HDOD) protein